MSDSSSDELLANPKQIANKETRTPEQEKKLIEISARESIARINLFFKTRWYDALSALDDLQANFTTDIKGEDGEPEEWPSKAEAALYFFATHEDIRATEAGELTEDQKEEIRNNNLSKMS